MTEEQKPEASEPPTVSGLIAAGLSLPIVSKALHWYEREPRLHAAIIAVLYGGFGVSMLLQPLRWQRTPAYHTLFVVLPELVWGVIFTAVAVLLLVSALQFPKKYTLRFAGLMGALMLTTFWGVAFFVGWLTSNNITPVTWGSFAVNFYLLLRAARLLKKDIAT